MTVTGASLTLTDDEATPTATLALSEPDAAKPDTIDESGAGNSSTVTAVLDRASSEAVTLTVAAAAGTNAAASDFTLSSETTLSIAAGETTSAGAVTVTAVDNTADGPDKSVTVTATVSGDSGISAPSSVTLTIADDDDTPTVALSVADSPIPESGGSTTVTAALSHPSSAATTVTVTAVDGLYTVGSDATVVIAAGETSNATDSVTITAVNDDIDNVDDRAVTVTGAASNARAAGRFGDRDGDRRVADSDGRRSDADRDAGVVGAGRGEAGHHRRGRGGQFEHSDGGAGPCVERGGDADGRGGGGDERCGERLHAFQREDAEHRGRRDDERRAVTVTAVDNTTDGPDKSVSVSATVSGDSGGCCAVERDADHRGRRR